MPLKGDNCNEHVGKIAAMTLKDADGTVHLLGYFIIIVSSGFSVIVQLPNGELTSASPPRRPVLPIWVDLF
jgi:hypothetical protein